MQKRKTHKVNNDHEMYKTNSVNKDSKTLYLAYQFHKHSMGLNKIRQLQ